VTLSANPERTKLIKDEESGTICSVKFTTLVYSLPSTQIGHSSRSFNKS